MIRSILIINNHGQVRMAKYYDQVPHDAKAAIARECFTQVSKRSDHVCNFLEGISYFNGGQGGEGGGDEEKNDNEPGDGSSGEKSGGDGDGGDDNSVRLIYRHYATLYFIFAVDQCESELGVLDLIQVFVESLDKCFENVCELDLIFHCDKVHFILDEIIMAGMVLETSLREILNSVNGTVRYVADTKSMHAGKSNVNVTKLVSRG